MQGMNRRSLVLGNVVVYLLNCSAGDRLNLPTVQLFHRTPIGGDLWGAGGVRLDGLLSGVHTSPWLPGLPVDSGRFDRRVIHRLGEEEHSDVEFNRWPRRSASTTAAERERSTGREGRSLHLCLTYSLTRSFNHSLILPPSTWHHFLSITISLTFSFGCLLHHLSVTSHCPFSPLILFPISTYICVMCMCVYVCHRLSSVSPWLQAVIVLCMCVLEGVIVPCGSQYTDVSVNITQSLWRCNPMPYALDSVCSASAQLHTHTHRNKYCTHTYIKYALKNENKVTE